MRVDIYIDGWTDRQIDTQVDRRVCEWMDG
jgi:hypothetical protein